MSFNLSFVPCFPFDSIEGYQIEKEVDHLNKNAYISEQVSAFLNFESSSKPPVMIFSINIMNIRVLIIF